MFTTEKAKSGHLTLLYNNKFIHSKYNPITEAENYTKNQTIQKNKRLFILIGPGLGYLKTTIFKLFPDAKIFSIHFSKIVYKDAIKIGVDYIYDIDTNLFSKLSNFISDFQLPEVKIIKWSPCTNLFPEITNNIEKTIQQFFLERKGSIYTIGNFGKTWYRNIFFNYINNNRSLILDNIDSNIVIAASGPSLADSLKLLKLYREYFILAALPSSLSALKNEGIIPDLIFHTDAGFWAKEHLKFIPNNQIPIVMPLTASFEQALDNPIIYINQNSCIENLILDQNIIKVQAHGTVAGTAYLFFRKLTSNPIIFIGLDLCYKDVQEHVLPHSFDILYFEKQNRFSGYLNLLYQKQQINGNISINAIKTNTAFSIYSGWFNRKEKLTNVYRYNSSKMDTVGLTNINTYNFTNLLIKGKKQYSTKIINNSKSKRNELIGILEDIIVSLDEFKNNINTMDMESIIVYFSKKSLLLEIFQYTSYPDIIKLSHNYRIDLIKSKSILLKIYSNSLKYISNYLQRYKNEQ